MKNIKFGIVILILIFFSSICLSEKEYFEFDDKIFSQVVLPLSFINGLPVVEVKIQEKTLKLILDTGADHATFEIMPKSLKDINVDYLDNESASLDVFGNYYHKRYFRIPVIQMGKLRFVNFIAGEELRDFLPNGVDGIIGNKFLQEFYVLIDYKKGKLTLYPKKEYPKKLGLNKWETVNFEHNNIGIILTVKIEAFGRELKLCLDTGCGSNRKKGKFGLLYSNYISELAEENNSFLEYDHVLINGIDLGRTTFWVVDFKEPPVDGFLGDNFFTKYKVFIDFVDEILFVKEY